jgi:hypothetical protein
MLRHVWTYEPGLVLARDGVPLVRLELIPVNGYVLDPEEAEALGRRIVTLLNRGERTRSG